LLHSALSPIKKLVDLGGSMPIFRNSKFKVQNSKLILNFEF
jgi:hypothetical protein